MGDGGATPDPPDPNKQKVGGSRRTAN